MSLSTNYQAASKYARELAADAAFLTTHDGYYGSDRGGSKLAEKVEAIRSARDRFRCNLGTAKAAVEESWSITYEARKARESPHHADREE